MEAIPGSPAGRGLTATRPGTPTAEQEGRAECTSAGSADLLRQLALATRCPHPSGLPAKHPLASRRLNRGCLSPLVKAQCAQRKHPHLRPRVILTAIMWPHTFPGTSPACPPTAGSQHCPCPPKQDRAVAAPQWSTPICQATPHILTETTQEAPRTKRGLG